MVEGNMTDESRDEVFFMISHMAEGDMIDRD